MVDLLASHYHILLGEIPDISQSEIRASSELVLPENVRVRVLITIYGYCITYFCGDVVLWSEFFHPSFQSSSTEFSHCFNDKAVSKKMVALEDRASFLLSCCSRDGREYGHSLTQPSNRVEFQDSLILRCSPPSAQFRIIVCIGFIGSMCLWTRTFCQSYPPDLSSIGQCASVRVFQTAVDNDVDLRSLHV